MGLNLSCESGSNTINEDEGIENEPLRHPRGDYIGKTSFYNSAGRFLSQRRRILAIAGLILSDFLRCVAFRSLSMWLPMLLRLYDPFFAPVGDLKPDKETSDNFYLVPVTSAIMQNLCAVIFGLVSDAWIRKTRMLLIGSVIMWICFAYTAGAMFEASYKLNCTLIRPLDGRQYPHCEFTDLITTGGAEGKDILTLYMAVILVLSCFKSMLITAIPALAGDQIRGREALKPLYTCYFWFWTLGDTAAILFCSLVDRIKRLWSESEISQAQADLNSEFSSMLVGISVLTLAASTLSTFLIFVVIFSKSTREPPSDVSVIVDSFGIWKQAFERRGQLKKGEAFLTTAFHRNGGNYPEQAVKEREHFGKYFLVILCILPLSYSAWLPTKYDLSLPSMKYENKSGILTLDNYHNGIIINVIQRATTLAFVPVIYAFSYVMRRRWGITISLLLRIVAGVICMVITLIFYVCQRGHADFSTSNFIFQGISLAFFYTAGYELAIVSAPRSMQATAMGVFFSVDGFSNLVLLAVNQIPDATFTDNYYYIGVVLNILSIVFLILIHKRWRFLN